MENRSRPNLLRTDKERLLWEEAFGLGSGGVGEGAAKGLKVEFPTVARQGHQKSLL